uniref:AB hydrolase-1 domain-containing protein n=2 Tax=Kalanchoe fedtschenkoi TaxID=63787 RepID=A0A7N0TTM1_KALFE
MAFSLLLLQPLSLPNSTNYSCGTVTIRCVLSDNYSRSSRVPYELKYGQSRVFHELPSGLKMEVLLQKANPQRMVERGSSSSNSDLPPLLFVHGSYHAAWCWAEHWMPYFSRNGFDCYAVSLLGQGESDVPVDSVAGTLQTHASDVANFIQKGLRSPPVLLGHSFGGLILQYYIAYMGKQDSSGLPSTYYPDLAGAALMCSVPPSGNSGIVWRYIFTKPVAAFKVTRSLAAKGFQTSLSLCKETFFSSEMEDDLVKRYQELMKASSAMPLFDLRKLNASLPVPSCAKSSLEILILGASDDFIVVKLLVDFTLFICNAI